MPNDFTPEEVAELKSKGLNPADYVKEAATPAAQPTNEWSAQEREELKAKGLNPDDYEKQPAKPDKSAEPAEKPSYATTVGRTLKRHAGGMVAGGLGGVAGAEMLPLAHVFPPYSEAVAGAVGGLGGALAGQKAQDVIQGDEVTKQQEAEQEEAAKANPKTALATDIIGSALAGGGMLNLKNLGKAGGQLLGRNALTGVEEGILNSLGEEGVSAETAAKLVAQQQGKEAIKSVAANALLNPAINTGIDLATGKGLPSGRDAIAQVLGGALFTGQSKYGKLMHAGLNKARGIKPEVEPTTTDENIQAPATGEEVPPTEQKTEGTPTTVQTEAKKPELTLEEKRAIAAGGNITPHDEGDTMHRVKGDPNVRYQKESQLSPDKKDFDLNLPELVEAKLQTDKPIAREQLIATAKNIDPGEHSLLDSLGVFKDMPEKMTPAEFGKYIRDNGPQAKVVEYGQQGKVSEAKQKFDAMNHEWFENLPMNMRHAVRLMDNHWVTGDKEMVHAMLEDSGLEPSDQKKALEFLELKEKVSAEPKDNSGPRATQYYNQVSPKDTKQYPVKRVDVVLPTKYSAKEREEGKAGLRSSDPNDLPKRLIDAANEPIKWEPDGLHENLPNTLGWAAIQYHDLPNGGGKVAHIYEAQSRWAQELRKQKEAIAKEGTNEYLNKYRILKEDHPLLAQHQRLILKAAIRQATKDGATHIALSDAPTAMMTEGHDTQATRSIQPTEENKKIAAQLLKEEAPSNDPNFPYTTSQLKSFIEHNETLATGRVLLEELRGLKPSMSIDQEAGMRLNYDKVMPKMLEELTGSKGENISFGEHKNAYKAGYQSPAAIADGIEHYKRDNLIFKNSDGTPKTDSSARIYPLDKVSARYAEGPNSFTGKRFQRDNSLNEAYRDNPDFQKFTQELAKKHGVSLEQVMGLKDPQGNDIAGVSFMHDRISKINMEKAGLDTGLHEIGEHFIEDLKQSKNPADRALYEKGLELFGGDHEALVEATGLKSVEHVKAKYGDLSDKVVNWLKTFWSHVKTKFGQGSASDLANVIGKKLTSGERLAPNEGVDGERFQRDSTIHKVFGAVADKIEDLPDKRAPIVSGAFKKATAGAEQLRGKWTNKFLEGVNKLELIEGDKQQLYKIDAYENKNGTAAPTSMFRNTKQRAAYKLAKQVLADNATHRQALNIPVTRGGKKTPLIIKPNYHPTTLDPMVAETYKSGDATKIAALDKDFLDHQVAHGKTLPEAQENLKEFKEGMGGKMTEPTINMSRFNGARMAHELPLPDSFKSKDWTKNMESYLNRMAADNSFYEHVESKPEVMEVLGEEKDPWGNDIPQTGGVSLANNQHVRAALHQFHGEIVSQGGRNEKGIGGLAATLFVSNPAIEAHKLFTNLINGPLAQASNPKELAGVIKHIVMNTSKGAIHAVENGALRLNATKLSDVVDRNVTFAGKLQAISKGIREISSLGGVIDKVNVGQMQAGFEYLIPSKVDRANAGDKTQQAFLKKIDPDYVVGKTYTPEETSKLASQALAYTQGTHDIRTMPSWMLHDTEVSGFFKLAHWSISQTNRFMNDVYEPFKKGDVKPMVNALFGSLVGGYLIKELREKIQGKHGSLPDLQEIAASDRGLAGNKGLVAYNLMASAQYAGFAGVVSQMMKYPFDIVYKNKPQGSVFPLDEITVNLAKSVSNITSAAANDPHFNWGKAGLEFWNHILQTDVQLARVVYNQGINNGAITGTPAEKKQLADKLGELRRFQQVSGLPFNEQSAEQSNPFMNLEQKEFKRTTDVDKAMKMLPELIAQTMDKYKDNPDVMMEKLESLKQNHYETMPSIETLPLQAMRYIGYLQRKESPEYAREALSDFLKHKVVNEVKAGAVP